MGNRVDCTHPGDGVSGRPRPETLARPQQVSEDLPAWGCAVCQLFPGPEMRPGGRQALGLVSVLPSVHSSTHLAQRPATGSPPNLPPSCPVPHPSDRQPACHPPPPLLSAHSSPTQPPIAHPAFSQTPRPPPLRLSQRGWEDVRHEAGHAGRSNQSKITGVRAGHLQEHRGPPGGRGGT